MKHNEIMLLALVSLKHKAELGIIDPKKGICDNLEDIINEIDPKIKWDLHDAFLAWNERHGNLLFPIAGVEEYYNYDTRWDISTNPHAQHRWNLLDHCIRYYANLVSKQDV